MTLALWYVVLFGILIALGFVDCWEDEDDPHRGLG